MSTHADKLKALLRNTTLYMLGLFFLTLAKAKHTLQGYTSSKPIPMKELEQCVAYDIEVVDQWLQYVNEYTDQSNYIIGKNVLELGPGSDLGAGLYLLSRGAFSHQAIDVNDLVGKCPKQLYELLFETLSATDKTTDINFLRQQLERQQHGKSDHLVFVNRADFDIAAAFQANTIDVVFSQAAFEHFDEIDRTINRLSTVVKSGGIAVIEIDLKTHTRGIRGIDPLNIYRFSPTIYRLFHFRGIPNRVRPFQYRRALEKYGWEDIRITAISELSQPDFEASRDYLYRGFRGEVNQMTYLSIMLCARKK